MAFAPQEHNKYHREAERYHLLGCDELLSQVRRARECLPLGHGGFVCLPRARADGLGARTGRRWREVGMWSSAAWLGLVAQPLKVAILTAGGQDPDTARSRLRSFPLSRCLSSDASGGLASRALWTRAQSSGLVLATLVSASGNPEARPPIAAENPWRAGLLFAFLRFFVRP